MVSKSRARGFAIAERRKKCANNFQINVKPLQKNEELHRV